MLRLSAVDAVNPAFEHMKAMLFRPFRFKTWLKVGFIGWLAGASSGGGCNARLPSVPGTGGGGGSGTQDIESAIRVFFSEHLLLIILAVAFAVALSLALFYLAARFRFILLDTVLRRDPNIGRGWKLYAHSANRYFVFLICFMFAFGIALALIIGVPLWRAFKSGVFKGDDPFAILGYLAPMVLGVILLALLMAVIGSLVTDFMVPFMGLDGMTIGQAWSQLRAMMSAEPGAVIVYLLMKFVLSLAAGLVVGIAMIIVILVLAIPAAILVALLVVLLKGAGPLGMAFGIILGVVGFLVGFGLLMMIIMLATAPVAVFMTSYALYFLGGRYPRLGDLLWPTPPAPIAPPPLTPPPPVPGAAPAM